MKYEEGAVQRCHVCACHSAGGTPIAGGGYSECARCLYPSSRSGLPHCPVCRETARSLPRPPEEPSLLCGLCGGRVPLRAVFRHFEALLRLPRPPQSYGTSSSTLPCARHYKEYRLSVGGFSWFCSTCGLRNMISDENELRSHMNEIIICCNDLRAMYSAMEYKDHLIVQCKKCLQVMVTKMSSFIREWLSSGHFGSPFCERKVTLLSDLNIGDHLVFMRKFYEHHVIVVAVDLANETFKEICFTTPKIKNSKKDEFEMIGKVLLLEVEFKNIMDPLFVIDYLPLDTYVIGHVIMRAFSKLDEEDYNLFSNNCEHMSTWCKYGRYECVQVKKMIVKYAQLGSEVINNTVIPKVITAYATLDSVVNEGPTMSSIHAHVMSQGHVIKESVNNSLKQMFTTKKISRERSPNSSKKEKK